MRTSAHVCVLSCVLGILFASAAGSEPAAAPAVSAPPPPPAFEIGLRAGWGLSSHSQGTLESTLSIPDWPQRLRAESGFSKAVNEVDLAVDLLLPWQAGIVRPFVTLGGGIGVGDNEKTGGETVVDLQMLSQDPLPPGLPSSVQGLTTATLEDVGHFYTRVGADLSFAMPGGEGSGSFHVRPYTGFDVRAYTATLGGFPSVLAPFTGPGADLPPDVERSENFSRVSPLLGAEVVVPLCSHERWGVDVYFGGEYQFDVGGDHDLRLRIEDATATGAFSGGNVVRGSAGFQVRFTTP